MAEWLGETSHGLFRRFPQVSTLVNSPENFTAQFWHSQLYRGGSRNGTRRESNCGFRFNKETGFLRHSIPLFLLHIFVTYLFCFLSSKISTFQVVLQFNRGTSDPDGDGNFDCIPAVDNFQVSLKKQKNLDENYKFHCTAIIGGRLPLAVLTRKKFQITSSDFGETWGPVRNISSFLKEYVMNIRQKLSRARIKALILTSDMSTGDIVG